MGTEVGTALGSMVGYGDATVGSAVRVAGLNVGKREGAGAGIRVGTGLGRLVG